MRTLAFVFLLFSSASVVFGAENYGPENVSPWITDAMTWDKSPVDMTFLNDKPAGRHGFVQVDGDNLKFEDGTPVNFWGCNVAASALFGPKNELKIQAKRIAALGFNLVRLHHQDSMSWVKPCVIDDTKNHTRDLNMAALDKMDWFVNCLKKEGVYVYYDLHVGRVFKPGDGIGNFAEMTRRHKHGKGYCFMDEDIRKLMQEHSQKILTHVNPYTRLSYARDPVFAAFLITNENDLAGHFGNSFLGDKGVPKYWAMFQREAVAFAQKNGLRADEVVKTWVPTDSKIFLAYLEDRFFGKMAAHVRALGVKVPIVGTNWHYSGLYTLPGMARSTDIMDNHVYDGGGSYLVKDPRREGNFMTRLANAHVAGKPFSISEWNIVYERDASRTPGHRASCSIGLAALGAHQGWDIPMIYNYRQSRTGNPRSLSAYDTFLDPALMGAMPVAAAAFRRDVRESPNTVVLLATRQQIYYQNNTAGSMTALRTHIEKSKTVIALEKIPEGLANPTVVALEKNGIAGGNSVTSDTGEITRDWARGLQTIDTPGTQVAQGFYGGSTVKLSSVDLRPVNPFAVICVTSMTGRSIGLSDKNLIYAISQCQRLKRGTSFRSQLVAGTVTVKYRKKPRGVKIIPLMGNGTRGAEKKLTVRGDGSVVINLVAAGPTHWFELAADFGGANIRDDLVGRWGGHRASSAAAGKKGGEEPKTGTARALERRKARIAKKPVKPVKPKEPKEPEEPLEPPEVTAMFKDAESLFIDGDSDKAAELFREIVAEHAGTPSALKAAEYLEIVE